LRTLRDVTATLSLGDGQHLDDETVMETLADALGYHARVAGAAFALAALLQARAFKVVAAAGAARIRFREILGARATA